MWTRWADPGCADAIVAFEAIEALRAWQYLKEGGTVIVNDETIAPVSVAIGTFKMPDDVEARLDALGAKKINAGVIARAAGGGRNRPMSCLSAPSQRCFPSTRKPGSLPSGAACPQDD
ncbi:2-oxoacid:acceptor oxidoreductase family protein [Atopobium sp. oral taxon 416]|uniref:2-oxoacid:acceptor oxidoreductase family protein n=1 Tax=Atopobium sp. oral taxon 416 TaxID=712157 RepID=UPI001BA9BD7A|nr:2-oxoacid:acceptor oxidoreductase family protein [Atopobium sp. oral taxon 416]QUC03554.1 2-oxoacid:acceptor oxidoreductase family protein [Atopobium sp. oral taxon 416]